MSLLSLHTDICLPSVANLPRQLMSQAHSGTQLLLWLPGTPNIFMTLEIDPLQMFVEFTRVPNYS